MNVLAESLAARLSKHGLKCKTVSISVRGNDLISFSGQGNLFDNEGKWLVEKK